VKTYNQVQRGQRSTHPEDDVECKECKLHTREARQSSLSSSIAEPSTSPQTHDNVRLQMSPEYDLTNGSTAASNSAVGFYNNTQPDVVQSLSQVFKDEWLLMD